MEFTKQEEQWFKMGDLGIYPLRTILEYYNKETPPANAYYMQKITNPRHVIPARKASLFERMMETLELSFANNY